MRRFNTFGPSMLMRTCSVAVLWLLFASIGYAAPAPAPHYGVTGRVCDDHSTTARKVLKHKKKSFGGPVARPSTRALAGLSDPTARMRRASYTPFDDDDDAIQNDAPAAQIDIDDRPTPALRPIGALPPANDPRLPTRAFTPRAPRGPPAFA
jgi:hypothetical protein